MAPPKHTPKEPSKPPPSPSPSPPLSAAHGDDEEEEEYTASSDHPSPPPNPLPKATTSSNVDEEDSDDDGDDGDDGGEGDSTDDGETPSKFTIKPSVPTPADDGGDDDSEGTEPESPPPPPSKPKLVKPLNTKPMDSTAKADSKRTAAATPAKRPAEASGAAGSDDEGQHPAKKQIIQRLWSEEDEITILKGLVEYRKKGKDPLADFQSFFRYIRKSLQLDCTHTQLSSKVRVFRSKFHTCVKRAKEGKKPTSNKLKDKLIFELSEKIWGSKLEEKGKTNVEEEAGDKEEEAKVKGGSEVANGKAKRKKATKSEQRRTSEVAIALPAVETAAAAAAAASVLGGGEERSWSMEDLCIRGVGVSEELVKRGVSLMDRRVVAEYEVKWKAMKMMEMEVQMKRADLVKGHIGAILEALKSGKR